MSDGVAAPPDRVRFDLRRRTLVGLVAATATILGAFVVLLRPSLLAALEQEWALTNAAGIAAIALGVAAVYRQLRDGDEQADPPLVEHRGTTTVPGEAVDAALLGRNATGRADGLGEQHAVRKRLRRLVASTLEKRGVDDIDSALDAGSWTDDPHAASFFNARRSLGWGNRARLRAAGDSAFEFKARHVVDAVADELGATDRTWTDPAEWGDVSAVREGWVGTTADLEVTDRVLDRWTVVGGLSLLAVGVGVLLQSPGLVLATAAGAGLLAYGVTGSAPTPTLAVEREVGASDPDPGDSVPVTVTVENAGDGTLFDLRLVDGVPAALEVEDGTPRHGTALKPGASATFSYTVAADRGTHSFDDMAVVARGAASRVERTATVTVDGDTTLACAPRPTSSMELPVRAKTTRDVGRVVTDTGGSGIEFHSVREYRQGDPLKRIDWRRAARGEDLATLQFNVERSTTVVLLVDARSEAFVATDRDAPSAVERSLGAASEAFVALLASDDRVGLATLGPDPVWLPPGTGQGHWALARETLTSHEGFVRPDPEAPFYAPVAVRRLQAKLPSDAQLVLFSPLPDAESVELARRLHTYGYPMTVVSPETTTTVSAGHTVAHLERRMRLSRLRGADVRIVDWQPDEPLEAATDRARRRWSR